MKKFGSIQALRAVAANLVVIYHAILLYSLHDHSYAVAASRFPDIGTSGVQCFFVISGFVMAGISKSETAGAFLRARLTRIYPIYWFYLALTITYFLLRNVNFDIPQVISAILLLPDGAKPILSVSWSLIHELYFYIVVALIIAFRAPLLPSLAVWAATIIISKAAETTTSTYVVGLVTHGYTLSFIAGMLVAILPIGRWAPAALIVGLASLPYGILHVSEQEITRSLLMGGPYVLILYGVINLERAGKLTAPMWLQRLGDASYSTYLSHILVVSLFCKIYGSIPHFGVIGDIIFVVVSMVAANIWGLLSYRFIELPILGYTRNFAKPLKMAHST